MILSFKSNFETSRSVKEQADQLAPDSEDAVKVPDSAEMIQYLQTANQKIKSQNDDLISRINQTQKKFSDKREWVNYVYNQGRQRFLNGQFEEAIKEWDLLTPHLESEPNIRELIEESKKSIRQKQENEAKAMELGEKEKTYAPIPEDQKNRTAQSRDNEDSVQTEESENTETSSSASSAESVSNFELVSGEITAMDITEKTISIKFSEGGKKKEITVHFDDNTRVNGSDNKNLTSLESGAEVDLRYDPETSRVVYIYIY
jgi:hypothetical protein